MANQLNRFSLFHWGEDGRSEPYLTSQPRSRVGREPMWIRGVPPVVTFSVSILTHGLMTNGTMIIRSRSSFYRSKMILYNAVRTPVVPCDSGDLHFQRA